jgi:hypothetical protein
MIKELIYVRSNIAQPGELLQVENIIKRLSDVDVCDHDADSEMCEARYS